MKKAFWFALALTPLVLAGCAQNTSKSVASLSDFLTVADVSKLKIATTSVKTASGSSSAGTNSSAASNSATSSAVSENVTSHSANFYAHDDFSIANGSVNYIGFTKTYGSQTQYFLINASKKSGFVTNDSTTLDEQRAATKTLISKDYSDLVQVYAMMQTYVGKTAADFPNMKTLSLAMSVEGDAAGYTLITVEDDGTTSVDSRYYLTLDQFGDAWAFTNYSKRVTTTIKSEKGITTNYSVAEYAVSVVTEYSALSVSLSTYSLYLKDHNASEVSFADGVPLTAI